MLILCLLAVLLVVVAFCYYQIEGFAIVLTDAQKDDTQAKAIKYATAEQKAAGEAKEAADAKAAQAAADAKAAQAAADAKAAQALAAQQAATTAPTKPTATTATTAPTQPANGRTTGVAAANPALLKKVTTVRTSTPAPLAVAPLAAPLARSQYTASMATPSRTDIIPQVTVSDTGYTAMELANKANFLQDIQRIVRQEIISSRNNSNNHPMGMGSDDDCSNSHANSQGTEYRKSKPDMSQYIKKDSIPCWNCDLDY